jgi:putative endonuclease
MKGTGKVGEFGEDKICEYLVLRGWEIIARNYHCRWGEIDIVAGRGDIFLIVEVKTRRNRYFANPCEAVTKAKQEKLKKSTLDFLEHHPGDYSIRFDVAEVVYCEMPNGYQVKDINYIENAFWEE